LEWLSHNLGAVLIALGGVGGLIATWVLYGARLTSLEGGYKELKDEVHEHQSNPAIHIDPARDKRFFDDFQRVMEKRFDRIEERLDKALVNIPPS